MVTSWARYNSPCVSTMGWLVWMSMTSPFLTWATAQCSVPGWLTLSTGLVTFHTAGTQRSSRASRQGRKVGRRCGDFRHGVREDLDFHKANVERDHMAYLLQNWVCERMKRPLLRRADRAPGLGRAGAASA